MTPSLTTLNVGVPMLSVSIKVSMLCVVMLSVVISSVVMRLQALIFKKLFFVAVVVIS